MTRVGSYFIMQVNTCMERTAMYDETQRKIIAATMNLVMEKGYTSTTTKDIAAGAGVNECTIFRRFQGKKEIILAAMELPEWNPMIREEDFVSVGEVETDLVAFSELYMAKVTPRMVKLSIGLRTPELYEVTGPEIMKIPETFRRVLLAYFQKMQEKGMLPGRNLEALAVQFLSMNFGFVFLFASFGSQFSPLEQKQYIRESVNVFLHGIL